MITLNYQTKNPRWGWSGIQFSDWKSYAFSLGYLANIDHYTINNGLIEVKIEQNDLQGAYAKEGRIQFYGDEKYLEHNLQDWHKCSSAGIGRITCRVNSNDYIYSLIDDYGFVINSYIGYTTANVFPPDGDAMKKVWSKLYRHLQNVRVMNFDEIYQEYLSGWNA